MLHQKPTLDTRKPKIIAEGKTIKVVCYIFNFPVADVDVDCDIRRESCSVLKGQIQSPCNWGIKSTLTYRVKVDSGIGLPTGECAGVDSGVDIRSGYSQLRHRVTYTMFFFGFGLSAHPSSFQHPVGIYKRHFILKLTLMLVSMISLFYGFNCPWQDIIQLFTMARIFLVSGGINISERSSRYGHWFRLLGEWFSLHAHRLVFTGSFIMTIGFHRQQSLVISVPSLILARLP
jgi:hypothetical protein